MSRLKAQLPIISPTAILGTPTKTMELMPVKSSGREVTAAIKIKPNHALPIPLSVAMISPYLESLDPLKIIKAEQVRNPAMDNKIAGIQFIFKVFFLFICEPVLLLLAKLQYLVTKPGKSFLFAGYSFSPFYRRINSFYFMIIFF